MKINRKQMKAFQIGSYNLCLIALAGLSYAMLHHNGNIYWNLVYLALAILILVLELYVLPKLSETQCKNNHPIVFPQERIIINGKDEKRFLIIANITSYVIVVLFFFILNNGTKQIPVSQTILFGIIIFIAMLPAAADQFHRCCKNTYIIEGNNFIINEWAWFRKKTDNLVIPISQIESIKKKTLGLWQMAQVEITVGGIKRKLSTGFVGNELYNNLINKMK